jgi:Kef-type K+ transport system membrane component KefB
MLEPPNLANSTLSKPTNYFYYLALLAIFGVGLWLILTAGSRLNSPADIPAAVSSVVRPVANAQPTSPWKFADRSPVSVLLLQIIVIIVAARLFGAIFRRLGQPPVMGEMVAGIALGPSVLGLVLPQATAFLFPPNSMTTLAVFSQVGVVLFMFVVGMELDLQHVRERASAAIMVSHVGIIVPFLLGAALALVLYGSVATPGTSFSAFALFMGIAMSITAFPVLARILKDRGLADTPLGSAALACASIDDVTAWCILAFVVAVTKSSGFGGTVLTFGLTLLFVLVMLLLVKPRIEALINRRIADVKYSKVMMASILAFVLSCAWFTETIGIHALFGGFIAGVVMPSSVGVQTFLKEKVESFSSAALLPLFFVFTGLRTQVSLLNDWWGWLMCLVIIVVAIAGKLGGSMLMARWTRMSWREAFSLGVLMNTRGLVELVVLNIGYDLGILSPRIFVMMVIMALATTFMTAPLLSLAKVGKTQ